ncbi:MAG: hypothetical protein RI897_1789 [Verrucomicrobiota bacterium]
MVLVALGGGVGDGSLDAVSVIDDGDMSVGGIAIALEEWDDEDGAEHEQGEEEESDEEAFGADRGEVFAFGDSERLAGGGGFHGGG